VQQKQYKQYKKDEKNLRIQRQQECLHGDFTVIVKCNQCGKLKTVYCDQKSLTTEMVGVFCSHAVGKIERLSNEKSESLHAGTFSSDTVGYTC
jgi:hypothetical protein